MSDQEHGQTIALHCENICNGGIQRVVAKLLYLLQSLPDRRWILLTDQTPQAEEYAIPESVVRYTLPVQYPEREELLQTILQKEKVSILWEHNYYAAHHLEHDLPLCKQLGIKVILHHHNVFSNMLARGETKINTLFDIYKKFADAMLVLSHTDEAFFRLLGIPAFYLPNPLSFDVAKADFNAQSSNILWLARMVDVKRPLHAVKIMQKVLQSCPDATMTMVGDGDAAEVDKVKAFIAENNLGKSITLAGFHKEVQKYYKNAALSLITSQFDGYNLTIIESKAFGVPVISYDMPYLETLQPGTGTVSVPQEDIDAAADIIIRLLSDPERKELKELSLKARKNYEEFAAFDLPAAYEKLFSATGYDFPGQENFSAGEVRNFINTMLYHNKIGSTALHKKMYREGSRDKAAEITSGLTWKLGHLILALPMKLYRILKGNKDA